MSDPRLEALGASMPFAKLVGLKFIEADKARVRATVTVGAEHCTAGSIAHGGFLMTLADCVGAIGAFLNLPEGSKGTDRRAGQRRAAAAGLADADRNG